jgi:hypothetical protein
MPDGGTCFGGRTPTVDPVNSKAVPLATTVNAQFGCRHNYPGYTGSARYFEITKPTDFTMMLPHSLSYLEPELRLLPGCDPLAAPILTTEYDCSTHHTLLQPGTYTFVDCEGVYGTDFITEAAPPAGVNANTSCATAAPMPYSEPYREYEGKTLYFKFPAPLLPPSYPNPIPYTAKVWVGEAAGSGLFAGAYRMQVQSKCGDATTIVYDTVTYGQNWGSVCLPQDGITHWVPGLLPTVQYWVVVTKIDPGLKLAVGFSG